MDLHLEVAGTGSYLPEAIRGNDYFLCRTLVKYNAANEAVGSKLIEDEERDIVGVTGIKERRVPAENETPSDMGYKAALRAIEDWGGKADGIVGIIMATISEDRNVPSGACKIQKGLGIKGCFAYDIANACAGAPEAFAQANARALKRPGNYLVVASEDLIKHTDDDLNSTLYGAGAGAAVLTPTKSELGILAEYSVSDPFDGKDMLIFRSKNDMIRMPDGRPVMKAAVRSMMGAVENLKSQTGWECADVVIPHQANRRIIDRIADMSPGVHVYNNIENKGNMSSATCLVALDEALRDGTIRRTTESEKGSRVLMVSFGSGLVTSGVAIQF